MARAPEPGRVPLRARAQRKSPPPRSIAISLTISACSIDRPLARRRGTRRTASERPRNRVSNTGSRHPSGLRPAAPSARPESRTESCGSTVVDRALERRKRADRGRDRLREAMETKRDLRDHAERALRADEEPREVVAGRRLARPRPGPNDRFRRRGRRSGPARRRASSRSEPPRCPTRGSPSSRRSCSRLPGSTKNDEPVFPQRRVELTMRDARLDRDVEILGAEPHDPVHARHVDRDASLERGHVPLERGAGAERHDRRTMTRADRDDRCHFFGRLGKDDGVRRI